MKEDPESEIKRKSRELFEIKYNPHNRPKFKNMDEYNKWIKDFCDDFLKIINKNN